MAYKKITMAKLLSQARLEPRFELSDKQLEVLQDTSRIIMALVLMAGVATVGAAAPKVLALTAKIFKSVFNEGRQSRRARWQAQNNKIKKSFYYLHKRGYIKLVPRGNDILIQVTEKGRRYKKKLNFELLAVPQPKIWDRSWWVVLADIPKEYKNAADNFRRKLRQMKFYPLQRTVWLYPFDPRVEVDFVSTFLRVERFVTTMKVTKLEQSDAKILTDYFTGLNQI